MAPQSFVARSAAIAAVICVAWCLVFVLAFMAASLHDPFAWASQSGLSGPRGDRVDQATPVVPADWHHVDLDAFSIWLPSGWEYQEQQGIDSFVGAFTGDGVVLDFDYGWHSNPLAEPGDPGYTVTYEIIGGKNAKLVIPNEYPGVYIGVYFPEVHRERIGCDQISLVRLNVRGKGLDMDAATRTTVLAIFRSIRFPGLGDWAVVPAPSYPGKDLIALTDVAMVSRVEGWAVGAQRSADGETEAALLHFSDGQWTAMPSPAEDVLFAVDMVSEDEGWAVGETSIVHYTTGAWTVEEDEAPGNLLDVEMVSHSDGWIAGWRGLMRYRNGRWQRSGGHGVLGAISIDMVPADEGWATGRDDPASGKPLLYHLRSDQWQPVEWPVTTSNEALTLEMSHVRYGSGWIGGTAAADTGWLLRHCEGRFEPVTTTVPSTVWDIAMIDAGGTDGWAGGGQPDGTPALLMHLDDDRWTVLDSPFAGLIKALDMVSWDEGWAVGTRYESGRQEGVLLHYTDPSPTSPPPMTTPSATRDHLPTGTPTEGSRFAVHIPVCGNT